MNKIEFDKALSNFLDDDECEAASEAVFQLIRTAFTAGWESAMRVKAKKVKKIDGK